MSKFRYDVLLEQIKKYKPKKILEVGTYNGDNAIRMCLEAFKYNDKVRYLGFDLFEIAPSYELPKSAPSIEEVSQKMLKAFKGKNIKWKLSRGDTRIRLEDALTDPYVPYDFVYIDGGHSVETIRSDWEHIKGVINEDSVIIFDDYYHNRTDIGAKSIVDDIKYMKVEMIGEISTFETYMGKIEVQMAKLTFLSNKK